MEERPMNRPGEHLMLLYGRGKLGLDDDEQLLRRFLTQAAPQVRLHAMEFVGRTMQGEQGVPAEVIDRFILLWDWFWRMSERGCCRAWNKTCSDIGS